MDWKKSWLILVMLSVLTSVAVSAPAALPPRLWIAKKHVGDDTRTVFLLAITHYGLAAEHDRYFEVVTLPKIALATTLYFEGAGNGPRENPPVCSTARFTVTELATLKELRAEATTMLILAREKLHAIQLKAGHSETSNLAERTRFSRTIADSFDEFDLVQMVINFRATAETSAKNEGVHAKTILGSVVTRLVKHNSNIKLQDVDSQYRGKRAYCDLGGERLSFVRSQLHPSEVKASGDLIARAQKEMATLLNGLPLAANSIAMGTATVAKTFICERNSEWLQSIQISQEKIGFYALGAQHLFPFEYQATKCDGMLRDLEKKGWSISIVDNKAE